MKEHNIKEIYLDDIDKIINFSQKIGYALGNEDYIHWKYIKNPAGKPRIFVVQDVYNDIKGIQSYIPRYFIFPNNNKLLAMQAVDAFILPEERKKSLYKKLLTYSTNTIDQAIYGFPNHNAERVELACGWKVISKIFAWYFPISLGGCFFKKSHSYMRELMNFTSRCYADITLSHGSILMREITRFNEYINKLNSDINKIQGDRSADYLNWRFLENPIKYKCYEFYSTDDVIGYCVLKINNSVAKLYDFIAINNRRECLSILVKMLRNLNIYYMVYNTIGIDLWRYGFIRINKPKSNLIGLRYPQGPFIITFCDSDWDT